MKNHLFLLILTIFTHISYAQIGINSTNTAPHSSAMLDVGSTTKGMLIPRMSSAQREAIVSPTLGLLVFDSDSKTVWTFDGAIWKNLFASGTELILPYSQTVNTASSALQITNQGTGAAIKGTTTILKGVVGEVTGTSGTAIYGSSNGAAGIAVHGETSNGNGVKGYGNNAGSIGVSGASLAGTGVFATSFTGLALDVNGKVKISGGNTNPSLGAVLTSDANGNAVWKNQKIAFSAKRQVSQNLTASSFTRLIFDTAYDAGGGFNANGLPTNPNVFVAPVSGYYYFSATAALRITSAVTNIFEGTILISQVGTSNAYIYGKANQAINTSNHSTAHVRASGGVHLTAGAMIEVLALANKTGGLAAVSLDNQFSGFLVFAD